MKTNHKVVKKILALIFFCLTQSKYGSRSCESISLFEPMKLYLQDQNSESVFQNSANSKTFEPMKIEIVSTFLAEASNNRQQISNLVISNGYEKKIVAAVEVPHIRTGLLRTGAFNKENNPFTQSNDQNSNINSVLSQVSTVASLRNRLGIFRLNSNIVVSLPNPNGSSLTVVFPGSNYSEDELNKVYHIIGDYHARIELEPNSKNFFKTRLIRLLKKSKLYKS